MNKSTQHLFLFTPLELTLFTDCHYIQAINRITMERDNIKYDLTEIPFKTSLSFEYLIAEIEKIAENITHPMNGLANNTLAEINRVPDLKVSVTDLNLLGENRELVNRMMTLPSPGVTFSRSNGELRIAPETY